MFLSKVCEVITLKDSFRTRETETLAHDFQTILTAPKFVGENKEKKFGQETFTKILLALIRHKMNR